MSRPRESIDSQVSVNSSSSCKRRNTVGPKSAVASLRQHLSTKKHLKRPSILGSIVPNDIDARESLDGVEDAQSPTRDGEQGSRGRRYSHFIGSVKGLGKKRDSVRQASRSPSSFEQRCSSESDVPTEPINIPRPPPLPLRLNLPPEGKLMPSPFHSSDDGQTSDGLDTRDTSRGLHPSPYPFPAYLVEPDSSPLRCLPAHTAHELGLRRAEHPTTPVGETTLGLRANPFDDLDGIKEPKAGIRKMRSLNDMLENAHGSTGSDDSVRALPPSSIIHQRSMADSVLLVSSEPDIPERIVDLQAPDAGHRDESTGHYVSHDPAAIEPLTACTGTPSTSRKVILPLRPKRQPQVSDSEWETLSAQSDNQAPEPQRQSRLSDDSGTSSPLEELLSSAQSWEELTTTARAGLYSPVHRTLVIEDNCSSNCSTEEKPSNGKDSPPPGITAHRDRPIEQQDRTPVPALQDLFETDCATLRNGQASDESNATTCLQSEESAPVSPMMVQELFYNEDDSDLPSLGANAHGLDITYPNEYRESETPPYSPSSRYTSMREISNSHPLSQAQCVVSDPFGDDKLTTERDDGTHGNLPSSAQQTSDSPGQLSPLAKQFYGRVKQSPSRNNLLAASTLCHLPQWSDPAFKAALDPDYLHNQNSPALPFRRQTAQNASLDSNANNAPPSPLSMPHRPSIVAHHKHSATNITPAESLPVAHYPLESFSNERGCSSLLQPNPDDHTSRRDQRDSGLATPNLAPADTQEEVPRIPTPQVDDILLIHRDELRPSKPTSVPLLIDHFSQKGKEGQALPKPVCSASQQQQFGAHASTGGNIDVDEQTAQTTGRDEIITFADLSQRMRAKKLRKTKSLDAGTSLLSAGLQDIEAGTAEQTTVCKGKAKTPIKIKIPKRSSPRSARPSGSNRYAALAESSSGSNRAMARPQHGVKEGSGMTVVGKENESGQHTDDFLSDRSG